MPTQSDLPIAQRAVFEGFQHSWLVPFFYILATLALGIFFYGVYRRFARYRTGRPQRLSRGWAGRILGALWEALTSRRVGRRDAYTGVAHGMIFWAFGFLFLGTTTIAIDHDVLGILAPQFEFWKGQFFLGFSVIMDISALLFLVGLTMMAVRRAFFGVFRLSYRRVDGKVDDRASYRREDWWFLGQLLLIGFTGLLLESFRLLHDHPWFEGYSPVGLLVARGLAALGMTPAAAGEWHFITWWVHAFVALSFIAYIPYAKSVHMLTSWANAAARDERAAVSLPGAAAGAVSSAIPLTPAFGDLSWKQLLAVDACTKCGRCHEVCPARTSGAPLSPRDLVLDLREYLGGKRGMRAEETTAQGLLQVAAGAEGQPLISPDVLWSCTTCRACVEVCPVGIEHVPIIVGMRQSLVENGEMDQNLASTLMNLQRKGNSFGLSERNRPKWVQDAGVPVKDARREEVEYLWYVGDFASYDPRAQRVSQSVARVLHHLGVDFGILYEAERSAGNDVRRIGEEGLFESLAERNMKALAGAKFKKIVTTDPHSYNTLKNEYGAYGLDCEVLHYTELLADLGRKGELKVVQPQRLTVTYHDPCYLGRYNRVFEQPRELMRLVGATLVEMPRNRENSFCCGAGGGRVFMSDSLYAEKPAESRIREASMLAGVDTFIVACPKDMAMYTDAVKTSGQEGRMAVEDVIFLVERALGIGARVQEEVDA